MIGAMLTPSSERTIVTTTATMMPVMMLLSRLPMVWARCTRRVATTVSRASAASVPLGAAHGHPADPVGQDAHLGLADQPVDQPVQDEPGDQADRG